MKSCLYTGRVSHTRLRPVRHAFRYRIWLALVELGELENPGGPLRGLWRRLLRLRPADHLPDRPEPGLRQRLAGLVGDRTGLAPDGEVYLLTGFGFLGHRFNPVSFFFCLDAAGELVCLVAEVTNTPWGERFYYVMDARAQRHERIKRFRSTKRFHVSPFLPMDMEYQWRFNVPGQKLGIGLAADRDGARVFSAALGLDRRPLTRRALALALLQQPGMSLLVLWRIHWQALRLWLKSVPFYPHPAGGRQ